MKGPKDKPGSDEVSMTDYTLKITCPFCKKLLVRDYETGGMDEDEVEALPEPIWDIDCPHVAAYCVWGFVDPETNASWQNELNLLSEQLATKQEMDDDGELSLEELFDIMSDYDDDEFTEQLESLSVLNVAVRAVSVFICKNDGPQGDGGPRFMIILMNRQQSRTTQSSRSGATKNRSK